MNSLAVNRIKLGQNLGSSDVSSPSPDISWTTSTAIANWTQAGAEIELDGTETAPIAGDDSVNVPWPFAPLEPRSSHSIRVQVTGADGATSPWSAPVPVFAAFLGAGEWSAQMIGLREPAKIAQVAMLRHEFQLPGRPISRATLYATAFGVYDVYINGTDVDDQVLKPGWTPYRGRIVHETTNVSELLRPGTNAIGVVLAGGWFTERYGFSLTQPPLYGEQPSVAVQLIVDYADGSRDTIVSSGDWQGTGNGPIRESGIYAGETYDARLNIPGWSAAGFDDGQWSPVAVFDNDVVPTARTSPPARRIEERSVAAVITPASGKPIFDFGQNLVGRLRIRVVGQAGTTLTIKHAEVLEDGELGTRPLRTAKATDCYTLRGGGVEVWEPRFTFHGFRYAQITSSVPLEDQPEAVAVVLHSDMRRTGWFETSDPLINRLHENVVWGMRGNFFYLPTDCPQRDERMGWTGDIGVFAPTAAFLYDSDSFLSSWLADLSYEQEQTGDGTVPSVVPNVLGAAARPAAAWGDAATIVPSVLYERYGDVGTLRAQFPSMKAWVDRLLVLAGDRHLWEGGFQYGDWLDPAAPPDDPHRAKTDPDIVAGAYLYRSLSLVARTAHTLGFDADASWYEANAARVRRAFRNEYVTQRSRILSDSQTAYALAIQFGLCQDREEKQRMGQRLAELVRSNDFRIGTGFVGTPLLCDALVSTGHVGVAERLVFQTENPSWLYPVTMGATTVWERWDSMLPDGSINPGGMTSFNHYALGAVADWLHRSVAGLAPASAGYKTLRIAPVPLAGLDYAHAAHETPYGLADVRWQRAGDRLRVFATVPPNTSAEVILPGREEPIFVGSGGHEWEVLEPAAPRKQLSLDISMADLADDPDYLERVSNVISKVSEEYAENFRNSSRWAADITLRQAIRAYPPVVISAVADAVGGMSNTRY